MLVSEPNLSIIIPVFNEEERIGATLNLVTNFLRTREYSWEIVVSDDGSTDSTVSVVKQFINAGSDIKLLQLAHQGKGWAIKNGMLFATGKYRFICDADLSMPIDQVERFFGNKLGCGEIVIGSREMPSSHRIGEPFSRRLMGRIYNILVRTMVVSRIADSQCGFKCFSGEQVFQLFNKQTISGFAFDVEILFLAQRAGIKIREINIDWYYMPNSKVRPILDSIGMVWDLVRIRWIHRFESRVGDCRIDN